MADDLEKTRGRRILGIDPGLRVTGYAVIEVGSRKPHICEAGVIRGDDDGVSADLVKRIRTIHQSVQDVINQFHPQVVVVEQLYAHYQHPRTAVLMAHARGVILLAAGQHDLPVIHYNPTRIKKTITGSGHATKDQVQLTIQRELGLQSIPEPADVADALAVALCHYYQQKLPI
jgi:crossover junction endodeoxyribonuclease RuvC